MDYSSFPFSIPFMHYICWVVCHDISYVIHKLDTLWVSLKIKIMGSLHVDDLFIASSWST